MGRGALFGKILLFSYLASWTPLRPPFILKKHTRSDPPPLQKSTYLRTGNGRFSGKLVLGRLTSVASAIISRILLDIDPNGQMVGHV